MTAALVQPESHARNDLAAVFPKAKVLHRHPLNHAYFLTEGVQHLVTVSGAGWLVDYIIMSQGRRAMRLPGFQSWRVSLGKGSAGELTCRDEAGCLRLIRPLHYTDFPYDGFELWLDGPVLGLPQEAS